MKVKNKLFIYQNLPSGGARNLYDTNIRYLKSIYQVSIFSDNDLTNGINSLIDYLHYVCFRSKRYYESIKNNLLGTKIAIFYQSWVTRSSNLLFIDGIPKLYICHEPPREFYESDLIKIETFREKVINFIRLPMKWQDSRNLKNAKNTTIIANSIFSKNRIDKIYGVDSKVIYPGINLNLYSMSADYDKRQNKVLSVGSINKLKNYEFIVKALSHIDSTSRPELIIAGNGGDKYYIKEIERLASDLNVKLTLHINIDNSHLMQLYKTAKLFLFSPINEPFGIVVLEAMASGLPVIAKASGGGYEEVLVNNKSSLLGDNYEVWAKEITELLRNKDEWLKKSKMGLKIVRDFSSDHMNRNLNNIINSIME